MRIQRKGQEAEQGSHTFANHSSSKAEMFWVTFFVSEKVTSLLLCSLTFAILGYRMPTSAANENCIFTLPEGLRCDSIADIYWTGVEY